LGELKSGDATRTGDAVGGESERKRLAAAAMAVGTQT